MENAPLTTFIVRIWWSEMQKEVPIPRRPRWHGRVEHVESGQSIAFRDLPTLLSFIQEQGGLKSFQEGR